MDREQAVEALQLLRRVVGQARDDTTLQNWGVIWMVHGYLYVLTIDRDSWNARFADPEHVYCEYLDTGPLAGAAALDSVLHLEECRYRWRPLRRIALAA